VIDEEFQNLLAGKKAPKEALDSVVTRGNKLIADFRAANG
jgi:sn-glycerol 3-phosphate transport system substrate-binding protein